jgi:hypothetical protein
LKRFGLVQYGKQTAERSECWQAWRKNKELKSKSSLLEFLLKSMYAF